MTAGGRVALTAGLHAVAALLESTPEAVAVLYVDRRRRDDRITELVRHAEAAGIAVHAVERTTLDRMCAGIRHQGVAAKRSGGHHRAAADVDAVLDEAAGMPLVLVLDGVQDPRNLGACLRCAEAAGVHLVVIPRDRSCRITPVVERAAAGAAARVPLAMVTNLARTLQRLKERGLWMVGADPGAPTDVYATDLRVPLALVVGAEGGGMRRLTREGCDLLVRLPMAGAVASLNVSVAAGILLYEILRQRRESGGQ